VGGVLAFICRNAENPRLFNGLASFDETVDCATANNGLKPRAAASARANSGLQPELALNIRNRIIFLTRSEGRFA
jgi:hypothetical protein